MQRTVPYPKFLVSEFLSRALTRLSGRTYSWPIMRIELAAARHMLRRRGAVYHVLYGETDFWFLGYVGRWTGNTVVASFHDGPEILRGHGIDGTLLRSLSAVVILGESQRSFFEEFLPSERVLLGRHGIDIGFFCPDESVIKEKLVITVGGHMRDYATLTDAIQKVWADDPSVRFVAVSTEIGHLGEPFRLPGVEYLTGISDTELLHVYRQASVAVFSFSWAVANNAVLEAMACGLPIVATNVGSVSEYVAEDAGILTPPQDGQALGSALLRMLSDPAEASQRGKAARAHAERFTYESVAQELLDSYRAVTSRGEMP